MREVEREAERLNDTTEVCGGGAHHGVDVDMEQGSENEKTAQCD